MINYLMSGIDKENGFTSEQVNSLKKDIKDNSVITFIASNFDNIEKTDKHKNLLVDAFNKVLDGHTTIEEVRRKLTF